MRYNNCLRRTSNANNLSSIPSFCFAVKAESLGRVFSRILSSQVLTEVKLAPGSILGSISWGNVRKARQSSTSVALMAVSKLKSGSHTICPKASSERSSVLATKKGLKKLKSTPSLLEKWSKGNRCGARRQYEMAVAIVACWRQKARQSCEVER